MKSDYQFVSASPSNPYHLNRNEQSYNPGDSGALGDFKSGFTHEVDDLVKLELAAEQMMGDEVLLAREYVKDDTGHFWHDLKEGFINWELTAGQMLLSVADPTRVEWQEHHWWGDEDNQFH